MFIAIMIGLNFGKIIFIIRLFQIITTPQPCVCGTIHEPYGYRVLSHRQASLTSGQRLLFSRKTSLAQSPTTTQHPFSHSMAQHLAQCLVEPLFVEEIAHRHNHRKAHLKLVFRVKPSLQKRPQGNLIGTHHPLGVSAVEVAHRPIIQHGHIATEHRQPLVKRTLFEVNEIAPDNDLLIT